MRLRCQRGRGHVTAVLILLSSTTTSSSTSNSRILLLPAEIWSWSGFLSRSCREADSVFDLVCCWWSTRDVIQCGGGSFRWNTSSHRIHWLHTPTAHSTLQQILHSQVRAHTRTRVHGETVLQDPTRCDIARLWPITTRHAGDASS
jgi:hypothetical protein